MVTEPKILMELLAKLEALHEAARIAVRDAYDAGRSERVAHMEAELKESVQEAIRRVVEKADAGDIHTGSQAPASKRGKLETGQTRAERGSAKPAVLEALSLFPDGVTTVDVYHALGGKMKYNTVRGTLYKLKDDDKKVRRTGDKWFLRS